ncbi:hypothetical protein EDD22DRAFT_854271 [Suillus occidentalis]|nr:hypothetical protein EDD22DRAFT_854271 [Suillus occidentalis]
MKTVIPVHEDGLDSSDRTRSASVDGLNQGPKPPEEPEIDTADHTSSGSGHLSDEQATSTISSFEADDFSVGSPRHVKEGHVARQDVLITTHITYETTIHLTPGQDDSIPSSILASVTSSPSIPTSTLPTLTTKSPSTVPLTFLLSTTPTANSSPQCMMGLDAGCFVTGFAPLLKSTSFVSTYPTLTFLPPSRATVISTSQTSTKSSTTTMSSQPALASDTVPSSTVMVSSPLPQSTSVPDTNSDPRSPSRIAAIVGGAIGAIVLLVLLILIAIWYRNKRRLTVTPFTLPSTAAQTRSEVWHKSQGIDDAVRPSSRGPSSVQHPDACLMERSGRRCPSFVADSVSSRLPDDDDAFASVVALHQQSHGVENWVRQVVLEECSRESSEVLPAYRSTKSLKSREGDDDHVVLPSVDTPLP